MLSFVAIFICMVYVSNGDGTNSHSIIEQEPSEKQGNQFTNLTTPFTWKLNKTAMNFRSSPSYYAQIRNMSWRDRRVMPYGGCKNDSYTMIRDKKEGYTIYFMLRGLISNFTHNITLIHNMTLLRNWNISVGYAFNTTKVSYLQNVTLRQENGTIKEFIYESFEERLKRVEISYINNTGIPYQVQTQQNRFNLDYFKPSSGIIKYVLANGSDGQQMAEFYQINNKENSKVTLTRFLCENSHVGVVLCQFCTTNGTRCYNCHRYNQTETIHLSKLTNVYTDI